MSYKSCSGGKYQKKVRRKFLHIIRPTKQRCTYCGGRIVRRRCKKCGRFDLRVFEATSIQI